MKIRIMAGIMVLIGLFGIGMGLSNQTPAMSKAKPPPGDYLVLEPSPPKRIRIPSIGVDAVIHDVGRDSDGAIATPSLRKPNEAGWYREGPSPGQYGPALIVGHVDTRDSPAVFQRISELKPGAKVEIDRRDRKVAVFEVTSVERFDKQALPVAKVYQDYTRPSLRLITCGGAWVGGNTGYTDNIIAFATLVDAN